MIDHGQYTSRESAFEQSEIKLAIEEIFKVRSFVNTRNREGKRVRNAPVGVVVKDVKRAIVTLREGTIDVFGMQGQVRNNAWAQVQAHYPGYARGFGG